MKKEDVASLIIYLGMIMIALILGFTLIKSTFEQVYQLSMNSYLFAIIVIVVGLLVNIIGLELGHIIGGKLGGYNIVMVNIIGFCFYKNNNKWKFGFKDFDGLTGETTLSPKSEKSNPKPFVWIPLLMYLVELIACIILYTLGSDTRLDVHDPLRWIATASIVWIAISSMMALYNFVPVKLDSMTDGYRLTLITKKVNVLAYNELMRIQNLQREGKEVKEVKVFDEITDFTTQLNLITIYEYLSKKEYDKAKALIEKNLEDPNKVSRTTRFRLIAQKLYINILTMPLEEAKAYYEAEVGDDIRRFISNDISMESVRAYVLIAGMLDESYGEVEFANNRKPKAMKRALASRAKIEDALYKEAFDKVMDAHPEWKTNPKE